MSVPTAEPAAHQPRPIVRSAWRGDLAWHFSGPRLYGWLALLALVIGALSLLFPSTPSYDPWSWLVWGREILHGSLHTPGGPTWKPLPVIFTTVFALFGSAQPNLWLIVARAGTALSVFMTGALAARLTWRLYAGRAEQLIESRRWARAIPAGLAALVAMSALALTGEYLDASTLGYSEGLMVAATLIALDRHLDGHHRQAFVFGFIAALDRPEIWLFWGPYGLWLMWRDPGSRGMVIGLAVLTLALWFVPQKWGGGSFTSGISRAHHPRSNSPAFAPCPFCAELKDHAWPLVLLRIKVAAALTVLGAAFALWRTRATLPGWRRALRRPGHRGGAESAGLDRRSSALVTLIVAGLFGLAWWVLVALETQAGFSGNDRYLVLGSAFIVLVGAVGYGWLAIGLGRLAARAIARAGRRSLDGGAMLAATALSALLFVLGPNFVGSNLINIPRTHGSLLYQAHLREDLVSLMNHHGGPKAILACGPVMSEGFQVPMVAWYLNVRTLQVLDQPVTNEKGLAPVPRGEWPATIFQDRDNRGAALLPTAKTIKGWEHEGAHYNFVVGPHHAMYFFQDCRAHAAGSSS